MAGKIQTILDLKILGTEKLVNLEKEIQKTEAALKKLDKTDKKNAKTIAEKRVKLKGLRSERNQEQKTVLAVNTATKKLDGSYNSLVQRNKALITSLKASKVGMKGSSEEIKKMKEEYKKNNDKLKEFDKTLGHNQRNVGNYGSALGGMKEKMAAVGMAIGAAVMAFAAMSRVVTMLIADFGEFEKSFTNVLTLMTSDDITQFHDEMQSGMLNIIAEYGFAIEDVNKALFDSVSAGVPAAESVEFMNVASNLALGGVTDLSTAVDGMTTIMNAFQLETSEANKIANAFFTAQKFGKTTVEELSVSIGNVAPHAKRAGMSYQELLAAMAELTKQGIKTDLAATALKSTITAIEKPSEKAKATFDKLGISYGTTAVRSQGLMNILTKITEAGAENADVLTELIPNIRALTGVSAMGTAQLEDYDNILQSVNLDYGENSSLANAVTMQQDTLTQAQNRLNGEWTKQKILLGEQTKPIIEKLLNMLSYFITHLSGIARLLKIAVVSWAAYNVVTMLAWARNKLLAASVVDLTIKQRIFNQVAKMNPYALAISAVTTLIMLISTLSGKKKELTDIEKLEIETKKKIADEQEELNKNHKQEIADLRILSARILAISRSEDDRRKSLDEFNKTYNTTVQFSSDYSQLQKDMAAAVSLHIDKIKARLVLQMAEKEILAMIEQELTLEDKLNNLKEDELGMQKEINNQIANNNKEQEILNKNKENAIQMVDAEGNLIQGNVKNKEKENAQNTILAVSEGVLTDIKNKKKGVESAIIDVQNKQIEVQKKANERAAKYGDIIDNVIGDGSTSKGGGVMGLANALKLEDTTLEKISTKRKELTKILQTETINSANFITITKELTRLRDLEKKAKGQSADVTKQNIQSLQIEINKSKTILAILKGKQEVSDEYNKERVAQLQREISLILLQAESEKTLGATQLQNIKNLKAELAALQKQTEDDDGKSPLEKMMYGEGVKAAFAGLDSALSAISGLMSGNASLDKVESDNKIHNLNKEKEAELQRYEESTKNSKMSEEAKATAKKNIAKKYDDQTTELKKTEFNKNKDLQKAEAKMAGAMAIMRIWSGQITGNPIIDTIIKSGLMIAQLSRTSKQIQAIDAVEFKGERGGILADGGMVNGKSHAQGGVRFKVGGAVAELEGGEAVINKRSTAMFRNQLSDINVAGGGKRFADGGLVMGALAKAQTRSLLTEEDITGIAQALSHQRVTVTESDITGTQNTISVLESRATF